MTGDVAICPVCGQYMYTPHVHGEVAFGSVNMALPTTPVMRYDIATDERVLVTQEYFDELERKLRSLLARPEGLPVGQAAVVPAGLKLDCYPNRMRPGQCFIAEAKEIEPYLDSDGRAIIDFETKQPYYPPVPKTDWIIHVDVNENFARELVRRWNEYDERQSGDCCVPLETEYTTDV